MQPSEIVQQARDWTWATATELSDAIAYRELNFHYYKIVQDIILSDNNYLTDELKETLTWWVNKYTLLLPNAGTKTAGQIKIDSVYIKYNTNQNYYTLAQEIDWDNMQTDPTYLEKNALRERPLFVIDNNSINIYPTPTVSVWKWLKIRAWKRPYDLDASSLESDVFIEREYHDVLSLALTISFYRQRQQYDLLQMATMDFEKSKLEMLRRIKRKSIRPMQWLQTDLSKYTRRWYK